MRKKNAKKALEIIESQEDKKMFQEVIGFLEKHIFGMSPIQIQNFILNDIEFPTLYSKFEQSKFELSHRYHQLVDIYYEIKEKELKIQMKERDIKNEKDELKKKLLELQKEKLELQLLGQKKEVKKIIKEARVFYQIYQDQPELQNLTEKEILKLEAETWARKTLNLPTTFEERYGKNYMIKAIGEENYKKYLETRKKLFGLLPRELFEVKQLPSQEKNKE